MNACLTTNSLKQRLQLLLVALILSFLSFQPVAHAALNVDKHVNGGIEKARLALYAEPSALTVDSGKTKVRFSVRMTEKAKSVTKVILSRKGDKKSVAMNDQGKDGDLSAGDGIYSVSTLLDASKLKPDACLKYEAIIKHGRSKAVSSPLSFCVNSFPVRIADSNTDKPAVLPDGTKVVADEIVITTKPNTKPDAIRRLAADINAKVVGSIPQLNLYQLKFASPPGAGRLAELVEKLNARPEVKVASASVIGTYTADPVPPLAEYNGLHGLKQIRAQDVWGAGASGTGVTVVVLDSGIDPAHTDFNPATCQLAGNPTLVPCTDTIGHGTQVAGVVAAKSNGSGMVGVAYNSKIHSIQVGGGANPTLPQIAQAFLDAANYIHPSLCTTPTPGTPHPEATVINASVSSISAVGPSVDLSYLCRAINKAVLTETISGSCVYDGPAAAVVVNAAGNSNANDYYYPARCNVNEPAGTPHAATPTAKHNEELTRKDLFITVSNSVSSKTSDCLINGAPNIASNQNGVNDRCEGNATVIPAIGGSNYGHWVDIAAPGSAIYTTTLVSAGSNATVTGTSFSAPMVSGAAAILASCGVPPGQIETALKTSAIVPVSYPAYTLPNPPYTPYPTGSTPRLDIYLALQAFLPAATNLNTAESYTEGIPLDLANIVVSSSIASCTTIAATLTLSDPNAGSLSSGGVNSNAAGVWTTSGTIASVNALLAGLTFNPNPNYSSDFTITTSVTDGISTINGSKVMTGIAVNSPPVNTIPAPQTATEDVVKVIGGISVVDADAGAMPITMTLTVTNGTISVNPAVAGGASVAGNGTASITLTGSQSQINTTLADAASVAYHPTSHFNGAATLTVNTNDNGASGGPAQSDSDVINITVASVNDAPVNTVPLAQTATQGVAKVISGISVFDEDAGAVPISMMLSVTHGTISVNNAVPGGVLAANITGNNTAGITLVGSQSQINATLADATGVTYTPSLSGAATLTVLTNDNGASGGSAQTDTDVIALSVTAVHPPIIADQTLPPINENSNDGTSVGTVVASDPDVGDMLTYSITAGNIGNAFVISGTGAINVNNGAALDFETTPVFNLTVRVTDSGGLFSVATVTINLNDLPETIPNPILVFDHKEVGTNYLGEAVDRYRFTVSNWSAYPVSMFVARPDLPPCGLNTSASRTWVDFYRASDNSRIYGFCALGTPANLNQIWFGMLPAGTAPPASVYITLTDRETGIVYTSNVVAVPFP